MAQKTPQKTKYTNIIILVTRKWMKIFNSNIQILLFPYYTVIIPLLFCSGGCVSVNGLCLKYGQKCVRTGRKSSGKCHYSKYLEAELTCPPSGRP